MGASALTDSISTRRTGRAAAWLLALGLSLLPVVGKATPAVDFPQWLETLRQEAVTKGISAPTLELALTGIAPIPRILELDAKQPERTISFDTYLSRTVTKQRIAKARELYRTHHALLEKVGRQYGVQPRFIVALWGMETDFGRNMGGFKVVDALATLAYDGRRSAYFRKELLEALQIIDEGHITADRMLGSWAGAMGQSQFMPSSFLRYAQDFNGDGRRDIWGTPADVFASAANYLSKVGWRMDQTWGREVKLPKGNAAAGWTGFDKAQPLTVWAKRGVRQMNGKPLPAASLSASLVLPDGPGGKAYLVYENYRTIMDWNRSTYFATAVGILADHIGAGV